MQESGPTTPAGDGANTSQSAPSANSNGAKPAAPAKSGPPRRNADPVVRRLTLAIFVVIILWLAGILSAVMFGMVGPAGLPRTAAERDIDYYTSLAQSGKATSQTYAQYVDTLIRAGQLSKAQSALDQSLKSVKADKSYLLAEQAQLTLANKDYPGTVSAANAAIAEAEKELKAFVDANIAANRRANAGAVMPASYSTALLAKAAALAQTKDYAGVVKAYDLYLKLNPTDSDILVMRANAKVQVDNKKGAAADYRAALKFIPDYQPALDGLKQIGAAK